MIHIQNKNYTEQINQAIITTQITIAKRMLAGGIDMDIIANVTQLNIYKINETNNQ